MKSTTCESVPAWHLECLWRLADDALILGQRLAQWCGHGPVLEEELAITNISLDLIGQARLLLSHAGAIEQLGRDEDQLAFFRDESAIRNHAINELPNGRGPHDDYALTVVRNLLCSARARAMWSACAQSSDPTLAAIAVRSVKESGAHLRHASDWTIRFGDGTEESHRRAQQALDLLWPYTNEFWADDDIDRQGAGAGLIPLPSSLKPAWDDCIEQVLAPAMLRRPTDSQFVSTGKQGRHTEHMGLLLAEMQSLARAHPQGRW